MPGCSHRCGADLGKPFHREGGIEFYQCPKCGLRVKVGTNSWATFIDKVEVNGQEFDFGFNAEDFDFGF